MGIGAESIEQILLAGAFGGHVRKESALAIGLLPPVPPDRIKSIGNAAGDGAILCLLSRAARTRALALGSRVEHIEISSRADIFTIDLWTRSLFRTWRTSKACSLTGVFFRCS